MSVAAVVVAVVVVAVVVAAVAASVHHQLLSTQCGLCWIAVELGWGHIYSETEPNISCIDKYPCISVLPPVLTGFRTC